MRGLHHRRVHLKDAVYLNARGVSFAILTTGVWAEVATHVAFMGYTVSWYSVRDAAAPIDRTWARSPASCVTVTG